jgi:hypothetical protein
VSRPELARRNRGNEGRLRKRQQTAPADGSEQQRFRIIHPFHPLRGREFELLSRQHYWTEERVRFFDDSGLLRDIPLTWTSAATEDAFLAIARGRSWFRFDDLIELIRILKELKRDV